MGISSLFMGESHTNPWNSSNFHRGIPQLSLFLFSISTCFRCHVLSLPPSCRCGGCRCVAGAAAPPEARKRKGLSSGESRGGQGAMAMAMAMVRIWVVNAILNPSPIFSHRYYHRWVVSVVSQYFP